MNKEDLLNLTEKAYESINNTIKKVTTASLSVDLNLVREIDLFTEITRYLKLGTPFQIPENGCYLDGKEAFTLLDNNNMNLPYPITVLEYKILYDSGDETLGYKNELLLTIDSEQSQDNTFVALARTFSNCPREFIIVIPIDYSERYNQWAPHRLMFCIDKKLISNEEMRLAELELNSRPNDLGEDSYALPLKLAALPLIQMTTEEYSDAYSAWLENRGDNTRIELIPLMNTLAMLGCVNVSVQAGKTSLALNQINKKRKKQGLVRIKPRAQLVIIDTKTGKNSSVSDIDQIEQANRSVKTHPRRGHIRRLSDDRKIWIRACIVNPNGKPEVTKYLVK